MQNQKKTYRTLLFAAPRKIEFREDQPAPLKPDEVRIETIVTGISRGTEMTVYRGTAPYYAKQFDPTLKLFRQSDKPTWSYPVEFGYENVGRIVEVGSDVSPSKEGHATISPPYEGGARGGYSVGDIVFTPTQHCEYITMSTRQTGPFFGDLVPILTLPKELKPEHGVFLALTGVAYNAMLDGRVLLGESVTIFGAGVIGLLAVQLCRLAGAAQIFAVDPIASRRKLAEQFGATQTFDPTGQEDISLQIRERTQGRGADLAIEVSGTYAAVQEAIRSVGYNGRVVVSSYLAGPGDKLQLGEEFHHNRIRLISSQSFGVAAEVSDRWSPARRTQAVLALLPKLDLAPMITHRFKFKDAAKAFEQVDQHPEEVLQVILEYED